MRERVKQRRRLITPAARFGLYALFRKRGALQDASDFDFAAGFRTDRKMRKSVEPPLIRLIENLPVN